MSIDESVDFVVHPGGTLRGRLRVPGDKSISHRALMLGAIADGNTQIEGFLDSEDTRATIAALQSMGVSIKHSDGGLLQIRGAGLHGLKAPGQVLNLGNSGTSVRLFTGLLSGQSFDSELVGDESLMQRPMQRVITPLQQMGAEIRCSEQGTLPVHISGNRKLTGISYTLPVASAQLKSAILLAGLYASGRTCVTEPAVTRDHSERMLSQFGCTVEKDNRQVCLQPCSLTGQHILVPGDISSAAFFMVAAAIIPGSDLLLEGVGVNPTRHAILEILQSMGADIQLENERMLSGEPVADLRVRHSQLQGIDIPTHLVPVAIDEMPVLMVAAACARGETQLRGAAELRVKESDRIKAMCGGLEALGIEVQEYEDGMRVQGGDIAGGTVNSCTDHRIAMAFSVAALAASAPVRIRDCANVNTSFPGFDNSFLELGLGLSVEHSANG